MRVKGLNFCFLLRPEVIQYAWHKKAEKKKWNGKGRQKPWSYTSIIEAPDSTCGFQQEAQMPLGWCQMLLPAKGDHEGRIQHSLQNSCICPVLWEDSTGDTLVRSNLWLPSTEFMLIVYISSISIPEQDNKIQKLSAALSCPYALAWGGGATTSYSNSKGKRAFTKDSEGISEALQRLLDSTKRIFSNQKLKWVS